MSPRARSTRLASTTLKRLCVAGAIALGFEACGDVLRVSSPGTLQEEELDDPSLEQFLINGAIGEFQFAFGNYALWSGALSDEVFMDHPNAGFREFSLHSFDDGNNTDSLIYASLQAARQSADDAAARVKKMLGSKAASSLNVARALIYGGYSYVLLGEGFCDAPVNLSAPLPPSELLARAIVHFDEGIAVATASRMGATAANDAAAQDLLNLARVGAARASLKKGDAATARTYALATDIAYERWAYYSGNSSRENNALQIGVRSLSPFVGMTAVFQNLDDPRIPQPTAPRRSLVGNPIFPPLKPSMYGGWANVGPPQAIDVSTNIRFASGLEARYIVAEADGPTSNMLAFVNARRAVAGKPPVNLTGPLLLAEFRMQRAIDFYLTGQRLGDLRRYALAGTDLFPTGKFPVSADSYGGMHCFIVPRNEKAGNPHY